MTRRLAVIACLCLLFVAGCSRVPQDPNAPKHGFLGITIADPTAEPIEISGFVPDSPAELCGLQPGDQILRVGRQREPTHDQLQTIAQRSLPGDLIGIRVARGQNELEYEFELVDAYFIEQAMGSVAEAIE